MPAYIYLKQKKMVDFRLQWLYSCVFGDAYVSQPKPMSGYHHAPVRKHNIDYAIDRTFSLQLFACFQTKVINSGCGRLNLWSSVSDSIYTSSSALLLKIKRK